MAGAEVLAVIMIPKNHGSKGFGALEEWLLALVAEGNAEMLDIGSHKVIEVSPKRWSWGGASMPDKVPA